MVTAERQNRLGEGDGVEGGHGPGELARFGVAESGPMANIFLVSTALGPEDRFTAHWCALLMTHPEVGQAVVDWLAQSAGLPTARFVAAVDHPAVTAADRPDCQLRTDKYDMFCEHKLFAPVGPRQLERYLEHTGPRAHLALIASQTLSLPQAVVSSERYIRPVGTPAPHFLWQDLYPVIARCPAPLVQQFGAYMERLGMKPVEWGTNGDPFLDKAAGAAFRQLYDPLVRGLAARNVTCVRRSNSLGLQIRDPLPRIGLFYAAPTEGDRVVDIPLTGRLFTMSVWAVKGVRLSQQEGFVPGNGPELFVSSASEPIQAGWRDDLFAVRNYDVRLDDILTPDRMESALLIQNVVERALAHLAGGRSAETRLAG